MEPALAVAGRFAENLVRARKAAGLSQEEVGWRASLHRTEVGLLERGTRVPRVDTLVKLAAALELPLACPLLEGIEWEPPAIAQMGRFAVPGPDDAEQLP